MIFIYYIKQIIITQELEYLDFISNLLFIKSMFRIDNFFVENKKIIENKGKNMLKSDIEIINNKKIF